MEGCMKFKWTDDKKTLLAQYYPNTEWEELYKILGTSSKNSIKGQAVKLGISRDLYNKCHRSEEEIQYILQHCETETAAEMGRHLNRNSTFVLRVLKDYNREVFRPASLREEDVSLFIELYPKYTNKYLHERYFPYLSKSQLSAQARKFNLVKDSDKGVKWYDKEDLLEQLEHVIREMGRVPMLTELQDHGLPSEKTFKRYFGGLTKACELIGVERPNYNQIVDRLYQDDNHNLCLSKVELDISNFLIQQNISFIKEYNYKNVIPSDIAGQRRFDWKIGDKYIEYFGLINHTHYKSEADKKIQMCKQFNINLLALYPDNIYKKKDWEKIIIEFLK